MHLRNGGAFLYSQLVLRCERNVILRNSCFRFAAAANAAAFGPSNSRKRRVSCKTARVPVLAAFTANFCVKIWVFG